MAPALHISIPHTSIAPGPPPYTQYHIRLQLPLRRHDLRKRYTDFAALHAALLAQTHAPPPAPLPPKSWLRRTVSSPALTEARRAALESYLVAVLDAADARWRSAPAWREFLSLPGADAVAVTEEVAPAGAAVRDPHAWLDAHRELKALLQTARLQVKRRETAAAAVTTAETPTAPTQHALAAEAKASLVRAAATVTQLEDGLRVLVAEQRDGKGKLGQGELRRRRDLVSAARKEVQGLEGVLRSAATRTATAATTIGADQATHGDKAGLWKGTTAAATVAKPSSRVLGGPQPETANTRERDNAGVLQLQQQVLRAQDEDVLALGRTVARLKDMGVLMDEELAVQNQMLGLLDADADRVQGKVDLARERVRRIG